MTVIPKKSEKVDVQEWMLSLIVSLIDPDQKKCKYELRAYLGGLCNGVFIGMIGGALVIATLNVVLSYMCRR
jgi:hypothetical protein